MKKLPGKIYEFEKKNSFGKMKSLSFGFLNNLKSYRRIFQGIEEKNWKESYIHM